MAVRLSRLAAGAPVPVFALVAPGWRDAVQELSLAPRLRMVATPRAATVLLVAGGVAEEFADAAAGVHDQLPRPRVTVCWAGAPPGPFTDAVQVPGAPAGEVAAAVAAAHRDLVTGRRASEPTLLPDEPPNAWRGVGPHGQGGEGMMGGTPYGRPMAMTADDRDGLALDALSLRVGPYLPGFPPGLVLDVVLQGDVVQSAGVVAHPAPPPPPSHRRRDPFAAVRAEPVTLAELETARARAHLRWCATLLELHGLSCLARRVLRLAVGGPDPAGLLPPEAVARLGRRLLRSRVLDAGLRGVGVLAGSSATAVGGPVARAAGHAVDARADDPAYRTIGFSFLTHDGGDARARWRQRLAEAAQAAEIAARAQPAGLRTGPHERVETPWASVDPGSDGARVLREELPGALVGADWGDAVTAIASLDVGPAVTAPATGDAAR